MTSFTVAIAFWMAVAAWTPVSAAPVESGACRGTCDQYPERYCEPWTAICELCPSECRVNRACSIPKCARYFQKSSTPPTTLLTTSLPAQPHRDPTISSSGVEEGGTTAILLEGVSKPVRSTNKEREAVQDNRGKQKGTETPNKNESFTVGGIIAVCASGVVMTIGAVVYHRKNRRHSPETLSRSQGVVNDGGRPQIIVEESGTIGGAVLVGEDQVFLAPDTQTPIQETGV